MFNSTPRNFEVQGDQILANIIKDDQLVEIVVEKVLIAAGRAANVEGMGLEEAKVEYSKKHGIKINDELKTTNGNVFAVGDCASKY